MKTLLLLLLCLLGACTIERRVHQNGFHIEWDGRKMRKVNSTDPPLLVKSSTVLEYSTMPATIVNTHDDASAQAKAMDSTISFTANESDSVSDTDDLHEPDHNVEVAFNKIHQNSAHPPEGKQRYHPLSIVAPLIGLPTAVLLVLWVMDPLNFYLGLPGLIGLCVTFILGVIAVILIKKRADRYRGKGLAWFAICFAWLAFILLLLFAISMV